ncbi:MAG: indole-3-glycerol phosphate synthase TrpC [Patescibacteria group bacterium]
MSFLAAVAKEKRREVALAKRELPLREMVALAKKRKGIRPFKHALTRKPLALIAEVKLKSPSKGVVTRRSATALARAYAKSRADAISVLTDKKHFGGSLESLALVRGIAPQPVLRKDFIIDEYQVYESKAAGADAILLIVVMLTQAKLKSLLALAKRLGLAALVEVHSKPELLRALKAGADIIGVNNRNLKTLKVDLTTTLALAPLVPERVVLVAESGFERPEDVTRARKAGADAVLVGTSVASSRDPRAKIRALKLA